MHACVCVCVCVCVCACMCIRQTNCVQVNTSDGSLVFVTTFHRGIDLEGNTVGIAFTRAMCSDSNSVGVTQDGGASLDQVSSTAAHELGHIFNMDHDSPPTS